MRVATIGRVHPHLEVKIVDTDLSTFIKRNEPTAANLEQIQRAGIQVGRTHLRVEHREAAVDDDAVARAQQLRDVFSGIVRPVHAIHYKQPVRNVPS